MMGYDGKSRGFAFVSFVEDGAAQRCKALLDTKVEKFKYWRALKTFKQFMEKKLHVNVSIPATRLFIGSIPKDKTKQQFEEELTNNGVSTVSIYSIISNVEFAKSAEVIASVWKCSNCFASWEAVVRVSWVRAVAAL